MLKSPPKCCVACELLQAGMTTFIPPLSLSSRQTRSACTSTLRLSLYHQYHAFRGISLRPNLSLSFHLPSNSLRRAPVSIQARPVSGDSDGELRDEVVSTPQKSYSVGITIVSGFDAALRHSVIEHIVSDAKAGRIVVVTTGGLASTDETDGMSASVVQLDESSNADSSIQPAADSINSKKSQENGGIKAHVSNLEGWISCSSSDEMIEVVLKIASSRECDYIIAECATGTDIEPQDLAATLHGRGGASLRVDTLVSVFDGDTLLHDLSAPRTSPTSDNGHSPDECDTSTAIHENSQPRPMVVVSLVENANVIVVHQGSTEVAEKLPSVQNVISVLNSSASIVPATNDAVPVDLLVNTNMYDNEHVRFNATWKKVLRASQNVSGNAKPSLPKAVKESTFLYKAKRPFHPTRLYQNINDVATFTGVIRSTGKLWIATRMRAPLEWNQAGVAATLRRGRPFYAETPESEWGLSDEERTRIKEGWDVQYGDRETEIVFVGIGMDKVHLQGLLDGCLLHDEEMVFTNLWEKIEDPFVEWVPLSEEDEEAAESDPVIPETSVNSNGVPPVLADENSQSVGDDHGHRPMEPNDNVSETTNDVLKANPMEDGDSISSEFESSNPTTHDDVATESVEGEVSSDALSKDVFEDLSVLNIFEEGFGEDDDSGLVPQTEISEFDEDDAVIASWDGSVADGILRQIPKTGIPVTVVTGFLGSGKTTLLNYILTTNHGFRIAVLVNEFGEIDIDNQLIHKGDWNSDEVVELSNGCICCDINESFVKAVEKILERKNEIDYILVETTGVANPIPVVNTLLGTDLAEEVRLDSVLTLVDAENFDIETNMDSDAALSQIMAADAVLLSKTDVASKTRVDEVVKYIRQIRPAARILRSQRGRVPIDLILDVGIRVAEVSTTPSNDEHDLDHSHDHGHTHVHDHDHAHDHEHDHDHDHEHGSDCAHDHSSSHLEEDGFATTSFKSDCPLDTRLFMDRFLRLLPDNVFRAKGLLYFYGSDQRYIFQLSGRRYQVEADDWPEGVAPGNQLVIIGKDLNMEKLRSTLESCHAVEGTY